MHGCHYLQQASITLIPFSLYQEEFQLHADKLHQSRIHLLNQAKDNKHELIYGRGRTQIQGDSTQQRGGTWNSAGALGIKISF